MSKITFIYPNVTGIPVPNIGLAYLISSVAQKHKANLIDLTFHTRNYHKYIINELKKDPPDAIGISANSIVFPAGLNIASQIKEIYPEIPIIFGGVHSTLLPEKTLSYPQVDAVCIGEGEETIQEYLDCLNQGVAPKGIAGLWFKENGEIVKNPLRPFISDLDSLPFPDWDYWDINNYLDASGFFPGCLFLLTSRGCIYNCTFCSDPVIRKIIPGIYYRLRSPEKIIEEIKLNKQKYGDKFKSLSICDETFGVNQKQLDKFHELYIKEGLNKEIIWSCGVRPDLVSAEWARKVGEAGCRLVGFGIESGDDNTRKEIYGKSITYQQIKDATSHLSENKVMYFFNFIIDGPGESKENIKKSRNLVKTLNPIDTIFHFYQPLPKTELYEKISQEIPVEKLDLYTSAFIKFWNLPREQALFLRKNDLKKEMWQIRIESIFRFLRQGFELRGFIFILDVIKYIIKSNTMRFIPLRNPYVRIELMRETIYRYVQDHFYQSKFTARSHS